MSKKVILEVPEGNQVAKDMNLQSLTAGQVIQHDDGFAVKVYDGLISFNPETKRPDGYSILAYSDEELARTIDFDGVRLRDDLRLRLTLEYHD